MRSPRHCGRRRPCRWCLDARGGSRQPATSVVATYDQPFSKQDKDAATQNMLVMGMVRHGAVTFAYPEDAKRNLFVQRKQ